MVFQPFSIIFGRPKEKFVLPGALETPRSQQAQHAREAWWWNINNNSIKDLPGGPHTLLEPKIEEKNMENAAFRGVLGPQMAVLRAF